MAYNNRPILTDVDGNPISQYYNPNVDRYEPVEGINGAQKVMVCDSEGNERTDFSLLPILEKLSQLTGTVIDEETRKSNELQRMSLYNQIQQMLANGELKGDKGDKGDTGATGPKGDKGDKGDPGDVSLEQLNELRDSLEEEINVVKYSPPIITYDNVINLPQETVKGQARVGVKGETLENLLEEQGLTQKTIGKASETLAKYSLSKLKPSKAYTLYAILSNVTNSELVRISTNSGNTVTTSVVGANGVVKIVFSTPVDFDNKKQLWFYYTPTSYDAGARANIEKVMILEGDYTNRHIEYITGTKSTVSAMRFRAVNKNLEPINSWSADNGITNLTGMVRVDPTKQIILRQTSDNTWRPMYRFFDANKNEMISNINIQGSASVSYSGGRWIITSADQLAGTITNTINAGHGIHYVQMGAGARGSATRINVTERMISQTDTTYITHNQSNQYFTAKDTNGNIVQMGSVGFANDEIRMTANGGYECVKRTKKRLLQASDFKEFNTSYTTHDRVLINRTIDMASYGVTVITLASAQMHSIGDFVPTGDYSDIISNVGKFYIRGDGVTIALCVEKGKYANITEAINDLIGTPLTYQLAEPIIYPVHSSGLQAYENGTLYVDYVIPEVGFYYNVGLRVSDSNHPIKSVDLLYKVDKATGLRTTLDVSKCVISEDKLSFTHEDLADGDLVDWDYVPTTETTNAEKTIIVPTNLKASVDSLLEDSRLQKENIRQVSSRVDNHNNRINGIDTNIQDMDNQIQDVVNLVEGLDKTSIGLPNVIDVEQMPITGGTFTGDVNHNRNLVIQPSLRDYTEEVLIETDVTGSKEINLSTANVFKHTLSGNVTYTFNNPAPSGKTHSFTLVVEQSATQSSITFPASVKWNGGAIPTAPSANKAAIYTFITVDGGAIWYGSQAMNEVS